LERTIPSLEEFGLPFVDTNSLIDLVLEYLMKVLEVIALEHIGTMLTLMKMWTFDVSCLDQAL